MKRFIEGEDRSQTALLPPSLDDYVAEDNPVRVVEAFVEQLDLRQLGFDGAAPAATGRPGYHPAVLLKLYVYGYLNRIQSSRRLEREAQRNLELMWLTGRLAPDFKTIANFRKDNGRAIRAVCRQFIVLCRKLDLFTQALVAIDGSKFKAVNNRDKNFTAAKLKRRMAQIDESIAGYLAALDSADRAEPEVAPLKKGHLQGKIAALKEQMRALKAIETQMQTDGQAQVSLTDPDARSMKNRDGGIVGYNVQAAVDAEHHLIVAHEVVTDGVDRDLLTPMAERAREATGNDALTVVADRGYFKSEQIRHCDEAGITPIVPKPLTSNAGAEGRFDKRDFIYIARDDEYRCPAGERAISRFTTVESRSDAGRVLDLGVSALRAEGAVHDHRLPPHPTLAARSGARGDAGAARSAAGDDAAAPLYGRAPVRHDQAVDGLDPLPDAHARPRAHRDEPARAGLQPEARDAHPGHRPTAQSPADVSRKARFTLQKRAS